MTPNVSRREFALLAAGGLAAAQTSRAPGATLTAAQVIEQIQKNVGVPWRTETVDTFKAGDPDTPVRGIATTFMATLDVLQRSAKAGLNLIVTHEPSFYNHRDETEQLTDDPVYKHKQDFIAKNNQVLWRFHDHWHARKPDPVSVGLGKAMGWVGGHQDSDDDRLYTLPSTTLGELAKGIQKRMKIRTMRVVGDPKTKVSKAAMSPGYSELRTSLRRLPEVDVLVVGEVREWEGVEYAQDTVAAGYHKGLILLGHAKSEDPGMDECATWLKTFLPNMPIEFVPAGEPFWNPLQA